MRTQPVVTPPGHLSLITSPRPRVVIVGAGFAGLEAARGLRGAPVSVTLIDRRNHHLFQPLLYQVATAGLSPEDIAMPIRDVVGKQGNVEVLMDEVISIDKSSRRVVTRSREVSYDFLIVATGAQYNYFGHDKWRHLAPGLKNLQDALDLRHRILGAFECAEMTENDSERGRFKTFVLIGGGPTGVEMAGAVAELKRALLGNFRRIDPCAARIVLVEAGPRLLPGFPEPLCAYAKSALERMGVEVRLGARVEDVSWNGLTVDGEFLPAATVVWCAGVKATPAAEWLDIEADTNGRVKVSRDLTVPGWPEIFVIGDAANVPSEQGKSLPGLAAVAVQEGAFAAKAIRRRLAGDRREMRFGYRNRGSLATIGRAAAVADLPRLRLKGWLAWIVWSLVHIYFLLGAHNRLIVLSRWVWSYFTYGRGARIIMEHGTAARLQPCRFRRSRRRGGSGFISISARRPPFPPILEPAANWRLRRRGRESLRSGASRLATARENSGFWRPPE